MAARPAVPALQGHRRQIRPQVDGAKASLKSEASCRSPRTGGGDRSVARTVTYIAPELDHSDPFIYVITFSGHVGSPYREVWTRTGLAVE